MPVRQVPSPLRWNQTSVSVSTLGAGSGVSRSAAAAAAAAVEEAETVDACMLYTFEDTGGRRYEATRCLTSSINTAQAK